LYPFKLLFLRLSHQLVCGLAGLLLLFSTGAQALQNVQDPKEMAAIFETLVDKRLALPSEELLYYGQLLTRTLSQALISLTHDQFVLVVDRNPLVQAVLIYWVPVVGLPLFIGASPTSTGRPGRFDYFETPLGVFEHTLENLDFRAEGTRNEFGIRGYGDKGMRVYDFGWQLANKGWGNRSPSIMRLQMHATDPDVLESRLGQAQSKGCIRIPASLNRLIDLYGLLDAEYEPSMLEGKNWWMLHPNRQPTPWSGRYLVVVETWRTERPSWASTAAP
jgi:hypothetical protein